MSLVDRFWDGMIAALQGVLRSQREIMMPVRRGNELTVMYIPEIAFRQAKLGDTLPVEGGGEIKKIDVDGWLQWEFVPAPSPEPETPPKSPEAKPSAVKRRLLSSSAHLQTRS